MRTRYAIPGDSAALATIQITSYRTAYAAVMPASYLEQFSHVEESQDWYELLTNATTDLLYVAELDDHQVVGYALGRHGPIVGYSYTSELVALHVLPTFHRRGIGRQLFAAIVTAMRQHGADSLLLWTLAANPLRQWYERLGGQFVAEQLLDIDGVDVIEVAYGWPDIDQLCMSLIT